MENNYSKKCFPMVAINLVIPIIIDEKLQIFLKRLYVSIIRNTNYANTGTNNVHKVQEYTRKGGIE